MGLLIKKHALKEAYEDREELYRAAQTNIARMRKWIVEIANKIMPDEETNVMKVKLPIPSKISLPYRQVDFTISHRRYGQVTH